MLNYELKLSQLTPTYSKSFVHILAVNN